MFVGITGKIGSGKSTIINYLMDMYNVIYLSTDIIAKRMIEQGEFHLEINSNIDKNQFIYIKNNFHPIVWNKIKTMIDNTKAKIPNNFLNKIIFIIETALPSDYFFSLTDKTIYIYSDENNIKNRLLKNRNYNEEKINNLLYEQNNYIEYYNKCDYIIDNNNDIKYVKNEIVLLLNKFLGDN